MALPDLRGPAIYEYAARIVKVVDGDTIDVIVDLGLDCHLSQRLRIYGINAPETRTPEGKEAKAWLSSLLLPDDEIIIRTVKDRREKYGRYLAHIQAAPRNWAAELPIDIATEMVRAGHAVTWDGKGPRP